MKSWVFHISLLDLAYLGTLFSGLTLALLLAFTKRAPQSARLFLSSALVAIALKTGGLTSLFLPALGPLLYLYVQQLTCPDRRFRRQDILHFCPLLVAPWIPGWLVLLSVITYLHLAHRSIQRFYRRLRPVLMDRPRFAFRRLDTTLHLLGLSCALSLLGDPFYLTTALVLIAMAVDTLLKPDSGVQLAMPKSDRSDAKDKAQRLKEIVVANRLYEDPDLTLATLAARLKIHPHDLSRIINIGLEKNFSDFINEFRIRDIARKMQDPASDALTLLGIAYDSGFNSKTTFNRVFKEMTGKTPAEYKNSLKKEVPIDKLAPRSRIRPVLLRSEGMPHWAPGPSKRINMLQNYFKIAFRNVVRHKAFSAINIAGLAVGMACSIFILLWVQDELSYDKFHKNAGTIYRVIAGGGTNSGPMVPELKARIPAIKNFVRFTMPTTTVFATGTKSFEEKAVFYADSTFLQVFSFPLQKGNAETALAQPDAVLITEDMARKYFGTDNPIGRILRRDNKDNVVVTGVLKNVPANSHLQFDFIMPFSAIEHSDWRLTGNIWASYDFYDYIQVDENVKATPHALAALAKQINSIFDEHVKDNPPTMRLQALTDIHLHSDYRSNLPGQGNIQYVNAFFIVALFILAVACINFMNLATARSARRAKEVGLRKVVGAGRGQLIGQFLGESLLISFIALLIAVGIIFLLLPVFNHLSGKELSIQLLDGKLIALLLGIAIVTGLVSGSYPALLLSGFKPVKVLKGNMKMMGSNLYFRNGLVIVQFVVSIVLLAGTAIVYRQLTFIKNRDLGYDKSNLLYMPMTGDMGDKQRALQAELKANPLTANCTTITDNISDLGSSTYGVEWEGMTAADKNTWFTKTWVTNDFFDVMQMKMASGRPLSTTEFADSGNYVINEKAAMIMGMTPATAIGKSVSFSGQKGIIVGVVRDFNYKPAQTAIEPMILMFNKWNGGMVVVRTRPGKTEATIRALEKISKELNPAFPFSYGFVDQDINNLYRGEQQMGSLFNVFAIIAIFISCMGLYGLSAFLAEQRNKEIGVRKVLGASVFSVVYLLTTGFSKLIFVAIVIAIPIAWFATDKWLGGFAYRIHVSWVIFLVSSLGALAIAWITVSYESLKAAIANPIKSLRTDA